MAVTDLGQVKGMAWARSAGSCFTSSPLAELQEWQGGKKAPVPEPTGPALTDFIFTTYPTKMDYLIGEPMEWAGASFTASYADGSKKQVPLGAAGLALSPAEGTILTEEYKYSSGPFEIAATYSAGGKSLTKNTWGSVHNTIIKSDTDSISVSVGETATFTVSIETVNPSNELSVSVNDKTVATASVSGITVTVTGVNRGYTGISVIAGDGRCSVMVAVRPQ